MLHSCTVSTGMHTGTPALAELSRQPRRERGVGPSPRCRPAAAPRGGSALDAHTPPVLRPADRGSPRVRGAPQLRASLFGPQDRHGSLNMASTRPVPLAQVLHPQHDRQPRKRNGAAPRAGSGRRLVGRPERTPRSRKRTPPRPGALGRAPGRTHPGGSLGPLVLLDPPGRRRGADCQVAEDNAERSPLPPAGAAQPSLVPRRKRPGRRAHLGAEVTTARPSRGVAAAGEGRGGGGRGGRGEGGPSRPTHSSVPAP